MKNFQLQKEITSKLVKDSQSLITVEVERSFENKKREMIQEFLAHPVTLELSEGITAKNISKTLSGKRGNLFSFIGFDSGEEPIKPILTLLESTFLSYIGYSGKTLKYRVNLPTAKDIFQVTPMPWAPGRSWAKGIETGISGVGWYIARTSDSSRAGFGIQSQYRTQKGIKFKNMKYISDFIKRYEKEFSALQL